MELKLEKLDLKNIQEGRNYQIGTQIEHSVITDQVVTIKSLQNYKKDYINLWLGKQVETGKYVLYIITLRLPLFSYIFLHFLETNLEKVQLEGMPVNVTIVTIVG